MSISWCKNPAPHIPSPCISSCPAIAGNNPDAVHLFINSLSAKLIFMKKVLSFLLTLSCFIGETQAQIPLTVAPSGGNKKASVSEQIGLTQVTIHYDRPGVKGREGKIWGQLVPAGFTDQGFGSSKAAPWRAGSNENTTIEFTSDVKINGQPLPAGRYGFFIAYDPNESILIFSRNSTSWGSFFYDDKEDVLRVNIRPVALDKSVEWLKYEFSDETANSAIVSLQWEKLSFPFKVEVDYDKDQIESFRKQLRNKEGFLWESWNQAAQWCLQNNTNLDQALAWADSATSASFGGDKSFAAWSTRAQLLEKLNRQNEADAIMKKTLAFASVFEVHQYGRQLIQQKKAREAMEVFKNNFQKNPNQFTTLVGMARGYSANGEYKSALKYLTQALPLSPGAQKNNVETMIQKLKDGKDIN
jgi:tetratricopeptide (TPR) repeat protein